MQSRCRICQEMMFCSRRGFGQYVLCPPQAALSLRTMTTDRLLRMANFAYYIACDSDNKRSSPG